ncbi:hypothetical protein ABUL39_03180 [Rhodothermus marinus]|uniref:hypothetical protein n=1 Tax=Rhodothermus marinus TaxID=29549 RepID=UPI0037CBC98A
MIPENLFYLRLVTLVIGISALTVWAIVRYLARRRPVTEGPALTKRELEQLIETTVRRAVAPLEARLERLERQLSPPSDTSRPPFRREAEQPEQPG